MYSLAKVVSTDTINPESATSTLRVRPTHVADEVFFF